jgi:hypothetical protein
MLTEPTTIQAWRMPRLLRAASACLLLALLAGCGASLIYPRLDSIVAFYFQDLVSLDDAQSEQLSRTLSANLAWHRQSELRKYSDFLRDLSGSLEQGIDDSAWLRASRQTEQYWRDIFEQAAPGYIAVARTLTDEQVAELMRNLERKDEDKWREFSRRTPEERRARREKAVARTLERFTGPLTQQQRALVRDYSVATRSFMPEWRENRRIWRDALAAALAERSSADRFDQRMTQLIARPDDLWTPQYRSAINASRGALVGLLADIDATLTGKQRAHARRELLALASEIQGLARGSG